MEFDVRLLAPLATLLAIVVSSTLWYLNKQKKRISYQVLRREALVNVKGPARRKLKVTYDGQHVEDAYLILMRVFNSGHITVNLSDYHSPLTIQVNPGAKILLADVADTFPADLDDRIRDDNGVPRSLVREFNTESVVLRSVLLNPGDEITVQLLARDLKGRISVSGHIQGISRIHEWKPGDIAKPALTYTGAAVMGTALLLSKPMLPGIATLDLIPGALLFSLGAVIAWAGRSWSESESRFGFGADPVVSHSNLLGAKRTV
ncbi:MAG TPA: hypothetical protein V6D17_02085 [Candidatus Obscuribacterales bacterium]